MSNPASTLTDGFTALINTYLGSSLAKSQLVFAAPKLINSSVTTLANPNQRNSSMEVSFAGNNNITPFVMTVNYNRLQMTKLLSTMQKTLVDGGESTSLDLIAKLAAKSGYPFEADDFTSTAVSRPGGATLPSVTFTPKSDSQTLYGNVVVQLTAS